MISLYNRVTVLQSFLFYFFFFLFAKQKVTIIISIQIQRFKQTIISNTFMVTLL